MTGYMLAGLIFLGGIGTAVIGELVNAEIRGWLDLLPHFILRIAARQLDPAGKITIYEDEWLPELSYILRGAEARPISRLMVGIRFSVGHVITAKRTARHLHRTPSDLAQPSPSRVTLSPATVIAGFHLIQLLMEGREKGAQLHAGLSAEMVEVKAALNSTERLLADGGPEGVMGALRYRDSCRAWLTNLEMGLTRTQAYLLRITEMEADVRNRLARQYLTADQD